MSIPFVIQVINSGEFRFVGVGRRGIVDQVAGVLQLAETLGGAGVIVLVEEMKHIDKFLLVGFDLGSGGKVKIAGAG